MWQEVTKEQIDNAMYRGNIYLVKKYQKNFNDPIDCDIYDRSG